jgi:endoglucanase
MDMMVVNFIDKGVPVIIGEYGCTIMNKHPEQVQNYILTVTEAIYIRGMCPMLWETNCHFNRHDYEFWDRQLPEGFKDIAARGR